MGKPTDQPSGKVSTPPSVRKPKKSKRILKKVPPTMMFLGITF